MIGKELKSCSCVLLRADHGHPSPSTKKGWIGRALLGQPSKRPVQDFNYFSIMFYYIISTTYKKIGRPILPYSYFWTFTQCDWTFSRFSIIHERLAFQQLRQAQSFNYSSLRYTCISLKAKMVDRFGTTSPKEGVYRQDCDQIKLQVVPGHGFNIEQKSVTAGSEYLLFA